MTDTETDAPDDAFAAQLQDSRYFATGELVWFGVPGLASREHKFICEIIGEASLAFRIAACLNACEGLSTEELESLAIGNIHARIDAQHKAWLWAKINGHAELCRILSDGFMLVKTSTRWRALVAITFRRRHPRSELMGPKRWYTRSPGFSGPYVVDINITSRSSP